MAVDYSKLSEEELKAIANNDYSKLSDATLEAIANKPKSAQAKPVEGSGGAAFGVYRPAGRRPESQNQNREANTDMAIQTIRGAASAPFTAAAGLPVDIGNAVYGQAIKPAIDFASSQAEQLRMPQYSDLPPAIQSAGNLMGGAYNTFVRGQEFQPLPEVPKAEKIPGIGDYGMNFYNQFVPGPDPANPAQQLAFAGSQALTGGLANKVVGGAIAAPRVIRGGANQVRTGAMEGVTNPVQRPGPNTAFAEMGDQVYPNSTVKPWQTLSNEQKVQGLPALEASQQPSGSLFNGFLDKAALRLAPEGPTGGKLVPLEGRGLQAFTEQTTRDLFNKPKSITEALSGKYGNIGGALAGFAVGGFPGAAAGLFAPQYLKALEILGQRRLQNKAALQPNFQQQLGEAQQTAGRLGLEGSLPQTPLLGYTPRQGGSGGGTGGNPTMYVGPTGEATTNLAGTQVNMNPGSLAAPTAAANAAMATTQRVATGQPTTPRVAPQPKPQPQPVQQPAPSLFEQPIDSAPQPKPNTLAYNSPDEMAAALVAQGVNPYDIKQMVKRQFNVDVVVPEPIIKSKPVEVKPQPIDRSQIPKTAEELASEQAILDLINQRRGVVAGDPVANREKFISNIPEIRKQLEQSRAENKSMYADRITSANENARIVNTGFDSKSVFSDADVIRHQINQTTQSAVRQANNKISVSKNGYDDFAETAGITLDWESAPNIRDMGLADARKTMSKWMFDQTDKNIPELGLKKRKESTTSIGKRHNAEIEAEMAKLPAEEKALMAANQNRPINNALQAALDKARANKGNAPPGVMKMITNEPTAIDKIKAAEWLTPEEFDSQVFMNTLGKDANKEFIAKMKTPEGSVIKAIDKELNSEAIQYADGSGFLVRKYREVPGAEDYTIFNNDGSRYEITKFNDGIRKIEIKKGDNIVAEYIKSSNEKTGKWAVIDRNAEGGGQMIYKGDLKFAKNPNTRNLHKELPKIDFNSVVQEQLARAEDLKKGK